MTVVHVGVLSQLPVAWKNGWNTEDSEPVYVCRLPDASRTFFIQYHVWHDVDELQIPFSTVQYRYWMWNAATNMVVYVTDSDTYDGQHVRPSDLHWLGSSEGCCLTLYPRSYITATYPRQQVVPALEGISLITTYYC